jgi:hypothetical protein
LEPSTAARVSNSELDSPNIGPLALGPDSSVDPTIVPATCTISSKRKLEPTAPMRESSKKVRFGHLSNKTTAVPLSLGKNKATPNREKKFSRKSSLKARVRVKTSAPNIENSAEANQVMQSDSINFLSFSLPSIQMAEEAGLFKPPLPL